MSDNQGWQAPSASQPPPPSGPPAPGPHPTASYAPPPVAAAPAPAVLPPPAPPFPSASPQGWTPPPKPGLVPLRPMTLGTILGASFQVMRRNPRTTLVPALVLALVIAIATAGGVALLVGSISRVFTTSSYADQGALAAGSIGLGILVAIVAVALVVVAGAMLQALIVTEIASGTVGQKLTFGQAWARARGRVGAVLGYGMLLIVAIVVALVLVIAVLAGVTAAIAGSAVTTTNPTSANIGAMIGVVLGGELLVFLAAGILWAWLGTKLAFVPSAIVLERLSIPAAIARSWRLTRGAFWRTFGILLLVYAMVYIATNLVAAPVQVLATFGTSFFDPTGASSVDVGSALTGVVIAAVVLYAVTSFVSSLGMVIESATAALLYLDLRMRKEGLDLELSRYVEARQTGAQVPDPYLPHAAS
ncbi:MAG TPA: glycerophosphoryl diester phosphodiesterase membrane domain-containing protein [Pseudolysinimonas sp.]|nr:glycerophosphoryl diester phosphodiesterase membrane domain-containing protein [Pseudolysinimonas sp.]